MSKTESLSRAAALDLLQAVLRKAQPMDESMARHAGLAQLERRDRAFVHALLALTLRRLGQIDDLIRRCLDKPHEIKALVHDILRLGVAQIVFLGTPPHAAVDTAVELAAQDNATRPYKGLINAVLRRLSREGAGLSAAQDAARLNTPDWLWTSWRKAYGVAKAREIALANMGEALTDLSVKADAAGWAARLGGDLLPTGSVRLTEPASIPDLPGFAEGAWWVQDAAAALPVKAFGDVKGRRVADLCAAPGGKAMQLASLGAAVTAVDRSAKRLERLRENAQRLGLPLDIICADALAWRPSASLDAILLDAPCSATGTMRRHPDVQRLKTPDDVTRMAALQKKLLAHAATLLPVGGLLVYAVCSLQPDEAEEQIESFLAATPSFARKPLALETMGAPEAWRTASGDLRCLPCDWSERGGLDGFFVSALMKKE